MSLALLREKALAERARILEELRREAEEEEKRVQNARRAAREAEQALQNAERAARAARAAVANEARAAERAARAVKTRKRNPGANYEIAGRPAHLAPGAPLRSVEGRRSHSRTLAQTRGRRTKAKYTKY